MRARTRENENEKEKTKRGKRGRKGKERKGKERKTTRETLYKLTTCNHGAERPELEDCDERGVGTRAVEAGSR